MPGVEGATETLLLLWKTSPPGPERRSLEGKLRQAIQALEESFDLEGDLVAQSVVVRHDSRGAAIAAAHGAAADMTLRLKAAGCRGEPRAAAHALPEGERKCARYAHDLAGGGTIEGWYVSGPLGLEQGFTVRDSWGCAGELEVVVAVDGASVEPGSRGAEALIVGQATGTHYRYGELYAHDASGRALAARMEVREGEIALLVDVRGAALPITIDPLIATEQAILTNDEPEGSEWFGAFVAVDGDTALVGAHQPNGSGGDYRGAAYVFVRVGETWTEQAKLTIDDDAVSSLFGTRVALCGDTALVGKDSSPSGDGEVYVFVRNGLEWSQQAKLIASDALVGFGRAIERVLQVNEPGVELLANASEVVEVADQREEERAGERSDLRCAAELEVRLVNEAGKRRLPRGLPHHHSIEVVLGPPHQSRVWRPFQEVGEARLVRLIPEEVDGDRAGCGGHLVAEQVEARPDLEPHAGHDPEQAHRDGDRVEQIFLRWVGVVSRDLVRNARPVDEADLEEVS